MKRKTLFTVILLIATGLTLGFIFANSALSREASTALSNFVSSLFGAHIANTGEELALADTWFTSHLIRKLAHVSEFALLAIELTVISRRFFKKIPLPFLPLSAGLLTALCDETLQIFSNRGASVTDVWVDGIGLLLGTAAGMLLFRAIPKKSQKRTGLLP
ncbi:MAG: VanZ family protein [Ruminococcaceae bacterium]|nr:VanZ family protein [Oscillospiraceae bacterium]